MADTPEQEIVSAISAAGWLQGDTVSGDALIEHISEEVLKGQFEGVAPAYWMLASHSCTVHARNLCDAPWIEWIAVKVKKKAFDKQLHALNPRTLHLQHAEKQVLELKIHKRVWTKRAVLPTLHRNPVITLSEENGQYFSYWMSHHYNRIAMPDELVNRLKADQGDDGMKGIAVLVDDFLHQNNQFFASAWVSFNPKGEIRDPAEPYEVVFRFLTKREHARRANELHDQLNEVLGVARNLNDGLYFGGADVTVLQDFTMLDAEDFVRYNLHDWLSVGDTDEDEEGADDAD